jgi:hypothetical protein
MRNTVPERLALLLLLACGSARAQEIATIVPLDASGPITYHIAAGEDGSSYRDGDAELALWALRAWERGAGGALRFVPAPEDESLIRVYFVPPGYGQYGEMRPLLVDGRRGAAVFIRPDVSALGPDIAEAAERDDLLRETIVYLTCLHELGHAIGLVHTADYDDVMYAFGYGGDIPRYFGRYRDQLESRATIQTVSGTSAGDLAQLRALYDVE